MAIKLHGSSQNDEIQTPQELFDRLNRAFGFDTDAFASDSNHLLPMYWTQETDALAQDWSGRRVFANPPYSRGLINLAVDKMIAERNQAEIIVTLIKVDTSTQWWQRLAAHAHIDYLPKRVKYYHPNPPAGWAGASFPSAICILKKDWL